MVGQVIQDVSVNIGATTADFETAVKRVLVGNQEIQNKIRETAEKSKKYADEKARENRRIADAEDAKVRAIRDGEAAIAAATAKADAARQKSVQSATNEAANRTQLAAVITANEGKISVAAIKRVASARAAIEDSLKREQSAAAAIIAAEQEITETKLRLQQIPAEQDKLISQMRESEARRLEGVLVGIENRMSGLYNRNQSILNAALEKEERDRAAAAAAALREANTKQRAADQAAAAAEEEARRVAAAKAKEIAAAEAAAAKASAAAFKAAEAQEAAAKQAMRSRQFMVQNMAFQVGDVFTQAQFSGYGRAIATQLPQMLGGFGMVGAVIGAAAAALAPFALKLFETEKAAEDAGTATEQLGEALDGLRGANDEALTSLEDLRAKYGSLTQAVIENLQWQQKAALYQVQKKHDGVLADATSPFGDTKALVDQIDEIRRLKAEADKIIADMANGVAAPLGALETNTQAKQALAAVINQLDRLRTDFGLTEESALSLAQRLTDLGTTTPEDSVRLANEIREQLMNAAGSYDAMTDASRRLYDSMGDVAASGAEVTAEVRRADEATRVLAGSANGVDFSAASASARALTNEIWSAHRAMQALKNQQIDEQARLRIETQYIDDPVGKAGALAGLDYDGKAREQISTIGQATYVDPIIRQGVTAGRGEYVEKAKAIEGERQELEKLQDARREAERAASKSGGGGGGGRGSADKATREQQKRDERELNEIMRESGRITESVRTEEQKRADAIDRINELQEKGMLGMSEDEMERVAGLPQAERAAEIAKNQARNAEVAAQAIQAINEQYSRLSDAQETVKDGAKEVFRSIVTGSGDARDALANMADQLSNMFADKAFDSIWGALSGSIGGAATGKGGGGLGGWISSALSSLGGYAEGTRSASRGLKMVGEKGIELIDFAGGERVYNNSETQRILASGRASGPASGHIAIDLTLSDDLDARIASTSSEIALNTTRKGLSDYSKTVAPGLHQQYAKNPRRKTK